MIGDCKKKSASGVYALSMALLAAHAEQEGKKQQGDTPPAFTRYVAPLHPAGPTDEYRLAEQAVSAEMRAHHRRQSDAKYGF